ncbi:MAG TPA: hypothetical protein ENO00_00830 [Deltaproteobacteria bacterium]|nr:hypothetical protein [Deltaproteobacteria bacterium]
MSISSYKIEGVLRAYNKQNAAKGSVSEIINESAKYHDTVTISSSDGNSKAYEKISYGLLDIILQNNEK